jgi:hypothetical protein
LEAFGAAGLARVDPLQLWPALPPRTAPREDFLDRDHVEAVTGAEVARCVPWRLLCARPIDLMEDSYTAGSGMGARTIHAGLRAAPDGEPEGWLPVVVPSPSEWYTWHFVRPVFFCQLLQLLLCLIVLLYLGNFAVELDGQNAGVTGLNDMCLREFETDDDNVAMSGEYPSWIDPSLTCYGANVSVHKLPLWRENIAALDAAVSSAGGVLKASAIWPAAVVCSPVLAAARLQPIVIGALARVTTDATLWGLLHAVVFLATFPLALYLHRFFPRFARARWPAALSTKTFAAAAGARAAAPAPAGAPAEALEQRTSLQLLAALQQLLSVRRASLHMVSYSWENRKAALLARFLATSLPDCWVDVARLPFTLPLSEQIVAQARHTRTLILLIDRNYLRSLNCCKELAAAAVHRAHGGAEGTLLTVAVLMRDGEGGAANATPAPADAAWDGIHAALAGLGFSLVRGPRTLQEWLVARSFCVTTHGEARRLLQWFRANGGPREEARGGGGGGGGGEEERACMATPTMLRRAHCCCAYAMLCSSLCWRARGQRRRSRLVAGVRALSADGTARGGAWGAGGSGEAQRLICLSALLLLVLAYSGLDVALGIVDGLRASTPSTFFTQAYLGLAMCLSALVFMQCAFLLSAAPLALWAADPRKRYDPLLHPLVVAAQCDDWMGATQGETPSPPRPFFRVLLAFDDAGAAAAAGAAPHAELPRCVANLAAFLGRDIGVTVARCGVEEALSLSAEPTATVTVFFLASAWAIAAWLERAPQEARARHVIVVCPCCAPRDSAIWGCLFVGACERARGPAPAAAARGAGAGATAPLLEGREEGGGGEGARADRACVHSPTLARDVIQALATKVPAVLVEKEGKGAA